MAHTPRLIASAAAVAVLATGAVVAPAAFAGPHPTPAQASFKVKLAACNYEPASDRIKAKGSVRTIVKQLPADEFYYLKGRVTVESRKPGTEAWQGVGRRQTSSIGFGLEELPFAWNAKVSVPVPNAVADSHELSLNYRIKLMQERDGKDLVVWRQTGRSSTFECGDG